MKPRCDNGIFLYLQKFEKVTFTLLKLSFSVVFVFLMELSEGQGFFFSFRHRQKGYPKSTATVAREDGIMVF